ncbi:MAG: phosphoribosylformylglycinamidine synthase subunit PurL [Candidatus Omnitrophica bacterium]|nr:phosphoribosylformylglycinamidine synthase subunit PurL [Candidatus Omnitrophota bacterium]
MTWRIEIINKPGVFDALGEGVQKSVQDFGINTISKVEVDRIYTVTGSLSEQAVEKICQDLLIDPITQTYSYTPSDKFVNSKSQKDFHTIEVAFNPGVMDPVEESTIKGIRDLNVGDVVSVSTARKFKLYGPLSKDKLAVIADKVLLNKIIQHVADPTHPRLLPSGKEDKNFNLVQVDLINANDSQLMNISREGQLFLNIHEMKTIAAHFKKLQRNPTDCELETLAQTWSEHCFHKTFRGNIDYEYQENGRTKTKKIKNLLKSTIVKATFDINKSWCVSVFHDNAGVIKFDQDYNVCFKVETHNHPSALEPFGGANTGIGGVIRDILGTGLGAKPICNTDIFCFAKPDTPFADLPPGTLHPKRVMKGVIDGVRDYGNKMGIPTVNGAILFDQRFIGNPLVYCGCVGIIPKDKVKKQVRKGDLIVVAGGKTGRDGIHGATFSSGELTTESETISSGAVQIGDPIQEKKVLDALLKARDLSLYSAVTDCGAGGLSSAVGEMGKDTGARVDLDQVPLKYQGLRYMEIWISESQERMVFSVPPDKIDAFLKIFRDENTNVNVIGTFSGNKRLEIFYRDVQVCDLDMDFLHEGNPRITKKASWVAPKLKVAKVPKKQDLNKKLNDVLSHFNVCSKEWVIRQYDHEVQGGSVIKPLSGVDCDGPSDASVIRPRLESNKGIAVSNGINIRYGMIDPFWMAASCIDEAIRQIICVGGNPEKIAILDNFCWGNPDKPDRLGSLVRAAEGCYKAAVAYQTPFISGKDSLYNEYTEGKKSIAIPGTLLISAIGIVEDVQKTVTMDFKEAGNLVYVVGKTLDELGGSIYLDTLGSLGDNVPKPNMKKAVETFYALYAAIQKGYIRSSHDCSEGGLAVTLAEMAFAGGLGLSAHLDKVPFSGKEKRDDILLFSESNSRFVVEVSPKNQKSFESLMKGIPIGLIGLVEEYPDFLITGLNKDFCINTDIYQLKESWQSPLRW